MFVLTLWWFFRVNGPLQRPASRKAQRELSKAASKTDLNASKKINLRQDEVGQNRSVEHHGRDWARQEWEERQCQW